MEEEKAFTNVFSTVEQWLPSNASLSLVMSGVLALVPFDDVPRTLRICLYYIRKSNLRMWIGFL